MGIAHMVITATTAAVVDLTYADALTNRTVLVRNAARSITRHTRMDPVRASSDREVGVHGKSLMVTTVAVYKDTIVRDMVGITTGESA